MTRPSKKGPTPRKAGSPPPLKGAILIAHEMLPGDDFEGTAQILFKLVLEAIEQFPGKPRVLKFMVTGHRNEEGGFDHDAWELISNFIPGVITPHLTEFHSPFAGVRMGEPQSDDMPSGLHFHPADMTADERAKVFADAAARGIKMFDADEFKRKVDRGD